ncbi:sigma-54-dependent Fis family transcriptional regulator [Vibrio cholerae]
MQLRSMNTQDWLASSWTRSSHAGLREVRKPEDITLSKAKLDERRFQCREVIEAVETSALPLFNQVMARTDSRLILTDPQGVILATWGQDKFRDKLAAISLGTGSCWLEHVKGTNAIGTALHERRALTIVGEQHYIKHHRFISCSASPLFNHQGTLVGILDVTSEQKTHDATEQLLVQNMVQMVENRLLASVPDGAVQLNLATDSSFLSSGWQGIVIADERGKVLAHNPVASQLIRHSGLIGMSVEQVLEQSQRQQGLIVQQTALGRQTRRRKRFNTDNSLHYGDSLVEQAWQQASRLYGKDISLLVLGETGVGKGEFVKALHASSVRRSAPLVTVNCGALAKELIESELFGHASGAFTGANSKGYIGKVRQADKGCLFLDEIGEMPYEAQSRLLTVLQDKVVTPVGSGESHKVDVQIIAATHQDLAKLVEQGQFRQDLYYRLNGLIITLPPLRARHDRRELIQTLHQKHAQRDDQQLSARLLDTLDGYSWPGNLRELDNLLKVTALLNPDEEWLSIEHLPSHLAHAMVSESESCDDERQDLQTAVNSALLNAYQASKGNISQVARSLGVSRNTVYRKLKLLGLLE